MDGLGDKLSLNLTWFKLLLTGDTGYRAEKLPFCDVLRIDFETAFALFYLALGIGDSLMPGGLGEYF